MCWDFTTFQFLKWHLVTYELLLGSHYEYGMAVKVIFPFLHPSNTPFDVVYSLHSCSSWSAHTNSLQMYLLLYKTHPVYRCFEAVLTVHMKESIKLSWIYVCCFGRQHYWCGCASRLTENYWKLTFMLFHDLGLKEARKRYISYKCLASRTFYYFVSLWFVNSEC